MKVQVRTQRLSVWQENREQEYEDALAILKAAGFNVEYIKTFTDGGHQEPGYISLKGQLRR